MKFPNKAQNGISKSIESPPARAGNDSPKQPRQLNSIEFFAVSTKKKKDLNLKASFEEDPQRPNYLSALSARRNPDLLNGDGFLKGNAYFKSVLTENENKQNEQVPTESGQEQVEEP